MSRRTSFAICTLLLAGVVPLRAGTEDDGGLATSCIPGARDGGLALASDAGILASVPVVPSRMVSPPISKLQSLAPQEDVVAKAKLGLDGRLLVQIDDQELALTLDAQLQAQLKSILRNYQTPYAAVVAMEPSTGRVLAMAEHSEADPAARGLCVKAVYPAASIFKIVTAAALLGAGVAPDVEECFHGGKRRLSERLLVDSARDSRCVSLGTAMGLSANVVFGKLTRKFLKPEQLRASAEAFGFNRPLPFAMPADVSLAAVPTEPFALSNTGAGFGDVYLSPLHGAALVSVAANGGLWRTPVLFERDVGREDPVRVLPEEHARALTEMMEQTVTRGTARRVFRERGHRVEGAVGKTGSLADRNPFRDYSWFVGFAPKEQPRLAVAAVVVNDARWRIRATWLGREALRLGLLNLGASPGRAGRR